jgi:hypothetical protein
MTAYLLALLATKFGQNLLELSVTEINREKKALVRTKELFLSRYVF